MTRTQVSSWQAAVWWRAGAVLAAPVEQAVRITTALHGYWFTEGDVKVLFYQAERKALPDGRAARSNYRERGGSGPRGWTCPGAMERRGRAAGRS